MSEISDEPNSYSANLKKTWEDLPRLVFFRRRELVTIESPVTTPFDKTLDALAASNEAIRERCDSIFRRADELIALRDEFVQVFTEVGKILRDAEETRSALAERSAMLELEEREHAELKANHRELREASEGYRDENSLLRSEARQLSELVSSREVRIKQLEEELLAAGERAANLANELSQERCAADVVSEKFRHSEIEIDKSDALIADMENRIAELTDRCATAEFHAETVEARLAEARLEHEIALELGKQREIATNDDVLKLKAELDAQFARAEAAETSLAEARAELHATAGELRNRENRFEQLEARAAPLDQQLAEAASQIGSLTGQIAEGEKSRALLADRAQALVRAMGDQKAKCDLANERTQVLEQRLAAELARFAAETDLLEGKLHELAEQVEREKNARVIAVSALEAARGQNMRQREDTAIANLFLHAETDDAVDFQRSEQRSRKPGASRRGAKNPADARANRRSMGGAKPPRAERSEL
jgi:chromosome segregation ATPase